MAFIEKYEFGKIKTDGVNYTSDLIIYPENIYSTWWRKKGHILSIEDIRDVINYRPEVVIIGIGTGTAGVIVIQEDLIKFLNESRVDTFILKTDKAVKKYNEISKIKKRQWHAFILYAESVIFSWI